MQQARQQPNSHDPENLQHAAATRKRRGLGAAVAVIREAVLGAQPPQKTGSAAEARRRLAGDAGAPQDRLREILERDRAQITAAVVCSPEEEAHLKSLAGARLSAFGVLSPQPQPQVRLRLGTDGWTAAVQDPQSQATLEAPLKEASAASADPRETSSVGCVEAPTMQREQAHSSTAAGAQIADAAMDAMDAMDDTVSPNTMPPPPRPLLADDEDGEEEMAVPIRTRTMARLLVAQGKLTQALSIYDELLAEDSDNVSLIYEADRVRTSCASAEQ